MLNMFYWLCLLLDFCEIHGSQWMVVNQRSGVQKGHDMLRSSFSIIQQWQQFSFIMLPNFCKKACSLSANELWSAMIKQWSYHLQIRTLSHGRASGSLCRESQLPCTCPVSDSMKPAKEIRNYFTTMAYTNVKCVMLEDASSKFLSSKSSY